MGLGKAIQGQPFAVRSRPQEIEFAAIRPDPAEMRCVGTTIASGEKCGDGLR